MPQTAAFYCTYVREINDNDPRVSLRGDPIPQPESGVTPNVSAVTLNDRHFTYFLEYANA
jgi:hypothetical protein